MTAMSETIGSLQKTKKTGFQKLYHKSKNGSFHGRLHPNFAYQTRREKKQAKYGQNLPLFLQIINHLTIVI